MGNTSLTVKDSTGTTKTLSAVTDAGNSSYVATKHVPVDTIGTSSFGLAAAAADATANPTLAGAKNFSHVFNGTTWDRKRGAPGTTGVAAVSSDGTKATYSTGASSFTLPATPTDVVEIKGSATTTVRIKRIVVSGVATTVKQWPLQLIRRVASIADGTPVTPVITKFDTGDAAATAVVRHFTALGTPAAANPASSVMFAYDLALTAPASAPQPFVFDACARQDKAIVLRGAADCLVINPGGGALTAGEKLSYTVEWEEDAS